MRFNICLAALAATVAFASPAYAQVVATDTATAEARGLVLQPLTLTKVDDLDFGTILASTVAGTVTIDEDSGNRSSTGGITEVASNPGQRALFVGAGTAGQLVDLTLAPPTGNVLVSTSNSADTILVSSMLLDNGNATTRTIALDGTFQVGVGGTFNIAASQANGLYKADFDLTADYQ
ncbi:MAG: DUF4402 domain-containing protein [Sphingomonas sp.]|uniref:DUF4402 domain-containing protein n=1 Tax=Sphingomonas sp. TaxID=28214 RepID=UPI00185EFD24|nr:DUF4402 domain-containing protein [Sphingomonas sp.]MBA3667470.1 DUF4402 domain-containing protein [Sphingomonas sp.]